MNNPASHHHGNHLLSTALTGLLLGTPACDFVDVDEADALDRIEEVSDARARPEGAELELTTTNQPTRPRAFVPGVDDEDSTGWVNGNLLHETEVARGHWIQFWELEPGVILTHEMAPLGENGADPSRLSNLPEGGLPVLELFALANPDADEAPEALLAAARREQDYIERSPSLASPGEVVGEPATLDASTIDDVVADDDPQLACSPDLFGDNWGKNWFLNNYCNSGTYRWCPTNVSYAYTGQVFSTWFQVSNMAADFWHGANNEGSHFNGLWWQQDYLVQIAPRYIRTWTYYGPGWRQADLEGHVPCQRVHIARKHNA